MLYEKLIAHGRAIVDGIYFDVGSDVIRPESMRALVVIADLLEQHPESTFCVEVHTDNVGQADNNLRLSEARAHAVLSHLIARGADKARLRCKGCGDRQPIAPNDTPMNRQRNRRVEIVMQPDLSAR